MEAWNCCNDYEEIPHIAKCGPCQDPDPQEVSYLFKEFRAFRTLKKGSKFGYYFFHGIQHEPPLSLSVMRFNHNKPNDSADRTYLEYMVRGILKEVFVQDQHVRCCSDKSQNPLLRRGSEVDRHVCDIYLTIIFNYHYFCAGCTMDICVHCYINWIRVTNDSPKLEFHDGLNNSPRMFILPQQHTDEDIDAVVMEVDELESKVANVVGKEPQVHADSRENVYGSESLLSTDGNKF